MFLSELEELLNKVGPYGAFRSSSNATKITSPDFIAQCAVYDGFLDNAQDEYIKEQINNANAELNKIFELRQQRMIDQANAESLLQEESAIQKSVLLIIEGIQKELHNFCKAKMQAKSIDSSYVRSLQIKDPPWIMHTQFRGAATIRANQSGYRYYQDGKTTRQLTLQQKEWIKRAFNAQVNFVIGVVNCPVRDLDNMRVSTPTLEQASVNDIEVFDSIHELERIYGQGSFRLGMIQINQDRIIVNDYKLKAKLLKHCHQARQKMPQGRRFIDSIGIYIVSESSNINGKISDILKKIPFDKLAQMQVKDVDLEIISCNTMEGAKRIIQELDRLSQQYGFNIRSHFYNGYIHNNISFCYIDNSEKQRVIRALQNSQNPAVEGKKIHDEKDMTKNSSLIQVMTPGFSNIDSRNIHDLRRHVCTKTIERGSSALALGEGARKVEKKLLVAQDHTPQAESWRYEIIRSRQIILQDEARNPVKMPSIIIGGAFELRSFRASAHDLKTAKLFYYNQNMQNNCVSFPQLAITNREDLCKELFQNYYQIFLEKLQQKLFARPDKTLRHQIGYYHSSSGQRAVCFIENQDAKTYMQPESAYFLNALLFNQEWQALQSLPHLKFLTEIKEIIANKAEIIAVCDKIIAEIFNDSAINKEIRKELADNFFTFQNITLKKIDYLEEKFASALKEGPIKRRFGLRNPINIPVLIANLQTAASQETQAAPASIVKVLQSLKIDQGVMQSKHLQ